MKHINRAQILGHVGGDPERHASRDGERFFVTFSAATNHRRRDDQGEQHVAKGDPVFVEGRLRTRAWQDSAGMDRQSTEIHAAEVIFLGSRETS